MTWTDIIKSTLVDWEEPFRNSVGTVFFEDTLTIEEGERVKGIPSLVRKKYKISLKDSKYTPNNLDLTLLEENSNKEISLKIKFNAQNLAKTESSIRLVSIDLSELGIQRNIKSPINHAEVLNEIQKGIVRGIKEYFSMLVNDYFEFTAGTGMADFREPKEGDKSKAWEDVVRGSKRKTKPDVKKIRSMLDEIYDAWYDKRSTPVLEKFLTKMVEKGGLKPEGEDSTNPQYRVKSRNKLVSVEFYMDPYYLGGVGIMEESEETREMLRALQRINYSDDIDSEYYARREDFVKEIETMHKYAKNGIKGLIVYLKEK
jgi:hypothetical protein